jgi:hypothetical protein
MENFPAPGHETPVGPVPKPTLDGDMTLRIDVAANVESEIAEIVKGVREIMENAALCRAITSETNPNKRS